MSVKPMIQPRDIRGVPSSDLFPVTLVFGAAETTLKPGPATERRLSSERRTVSAVATLHRIDRSSLPHRFHLAEVTGRLVQGADDESAPVRYVGEKAEDAYEQTLILPVSLPSIRDRLGIPKGVSMNVELRSTAPNNRAFFDSVRKALKKHVL